MDNKKRILCVDDDPNILSGIDAVCGMDAICLG